MNREPGCIKPDTDTQVFFYEQDFYVLSNFSAFTLSWKGYRFDTSEAAYHWEKFDGSDSEVQDMILEAPTEGAVSWRCFHCEYVARTREEGIAHFGLVMNARQPTCVAAGKAVTDSCEVTEAKRQEGEKA